MAGASWFVQDALGLAPWPELVLSGTASLLVFAGVGWVFGLNTEDRVKVIGYARQAWARVEGLLGRS
jgi:hypothetical protein